MADEELKQESRHLKGEERQAKRQEKVRGVQLKAMKRMQKESGRAGAAAGGAVADVGTQAPIMAGRAALEAGEKALDVATLGAYTPIDIATTIGGSVFQKGAGKAAKYGVGRPLGKQIGKAPFRPAIAIQKRRVSAAKKKGKKAKAARKQIDREIAQDKSAPEKMLSLLIKGASGIAIKTVMIPFELVLGLIMSILIPILLLLLLVWLVMTLSTSVFSLLSPF